MNEVITMKRFIVGCAVAASTLAVGAGAAGAGVPAVKGCVGESVRVATKALHPYGRNFVTGVTPRSDFGSFGAAVQIFQAGGIPDDLYPSTCNDV